VSLLFNIVILISVLYVKNTKLYSLFKLKMHQKQWRPGCRSSQCSPWHPSGITEVKGEGEGKYRKRGGEGEKGKEYLPHLRYSSGNASDW